jgi:hypothetical protein
MLKYDTDKYSRIIINGYINTYNIEQNASDDPKALEIHELVNNNKLSVDANKSTYHSIEELLQSVKYSLTEENLIISNSFFSKVIFSK